MPPPAESDPIEPDTPPGPCRWRKPDPLPTVACETPRLICRFYTPEDADALYRETLESGPSLLPWLPWAADPHKDPAAAGALIDDFSRRAGLAEADDFVLGLFDRTDGRLVGGTGFHRIDTEAACAEIGYWIVADRRREGLCREAIGALISAGFHTWGFRRIKICCAAPNLGSVHVIERLGLRLEARERAERHVEGLGFVDSLTYAVLDHEWDAARQRGPGGTSIDA